MLMIYRIIHVLEVNLCAFTGCAEGGNYHTIHASELIDSLLSNRDKRRPVVRRTPLTTLSRTWSLSTAVLSPVTVRGPAQENTSDYP